MSGIRLTIDDSTNYISQASPGRKSTLELEIDEMENIFFNIEGVSASVIPDPAPVPTISLPVPMPSDNNENYYSSTPPSCSSNGSYSTGPLLSAPPSPSLVGFEPPRSLPGGVDWSAVLDSKMAMRLPSPESHSSFHGDEPLPEPTSPSCGSTSGDNHSSYEGGSSPALHSVASDFGDLRLNTDIFQHDPLHDQPEWSQMPSPGLLAPGPHHVNVRRWSSAGNQSRRATHQRFASQQLPSPSEKLEFTNDGMGRGRSLTRAASAPGSSAPSRRHSPYPPQNVDTLYETSLPEGEASVPFHPVVGPPSPSGEDKVDVTIVKETVTPVKIARAAALRRKNPALFTCDFCSTTFTTKFKRDSHVDAHEGKKEFACTSCGKAFTRKSDCVRHERNTKKCNPNPSPVSPISPISPVSPS